ncbi:hypothetical protein [Dictyobacter aurantiacus]|uniref:Uncharacterized protein n=1 Tax=Dictyobacter aurantiacus TaxID=1936993 RepID=A0A401Z9L9_9CHLR|nr:hypothetical protein [Dictyobacter aurantiacus]GCE03571.1 hypothetical protein KDAU_09000 [Dictyobacter aurantiacus]
MGWQITAFCVEHMTPQELIQDFPCSFSPTGQRFSAEDVFSAMLPVPFAIGQMGAWTVLCDPLCIITWREQMLATFSRGRRIFAFVAEDASGIYGFWYFVDGSLLREVLFQDGICVEEEGALLSEERALRRPWGYDEQNVLSLLEQVTGFGWKQLRECFFQGLENDLYSNIRAV